MIRGKKGGTISLGINMALFSCFILSILLFANQFAVDNNSPVSLAQDSNLNSNINRLNGSLETYQSSDNITITSLYGSSIEPGSDTLSRVSTFSSSNEDTLPDVTDTFSTSVLAVFGNNRNILLMAGAATALLALIIGLYAWKTLKGGAPD